MAHALFGGLQSRRGTAERLGQGQDEPRAAGSPFRGAAGVGPEVFRGSLCREWGPKRPWGTFPGPFSLSRGEVHTVLGWQRGRGLPVPL